MCSQSTPLISEPEILSALLIDKFEDVKEYIWPSQGLDFDFVGSESLLPQHILLKSMIKVLQKYVEDLKCQKQKKKSVVSLS